MGCRVLTPLVAALVNACVLTCFQKTDWKTRDNLTLHSLTLSKEVHGSEMSGPLAVNA